MSKFAPFGIKGFIKGKGSAARRKNILRLIVAVGVLNLGPAVWFLFVLYLDLVVPPKASAVPAFFAAALAALSVFLFLNFGYAFFGAKPWAKKLYTEDEIKEPEEKRSWRRILHGTFSWRLFSTSWYFLCWPCS